MNPKIDIRPSPIAGYWYSGNENILRTQINNFLENVSIPEMEGEVIGVISPHAGYRFSGQTAAYSFKAVKNKDIDLVVVLSPYHSYHSAHMLTSAHEYYQTPLGKIHVDRKLVETILDKSKTEKLLKFTQIANDEEHSLEIELPFLQCVIQKDFELLPLMIRSINPQQAEYIAELVFNQVKNKKVLIVASTDLSHFYPQAIAEQLDQEMLTQIQSFSHEKVFQTEMEGKGYACGLGAVMISMVLSKKFGADRIRILHHTTSGKETGDYSSVVGYGAGVFIKSLT